MAGKVDVCLFDKTGTLTTDELVAVGVEPPTPLLSSASRGKTSANGDTEGNAGAVNDTLVTMPDAPAAATLVLAGCQSLVLVEGSEAGDPVEAAAMKAIKVSQSTCPVIRGRSSTCVFVVDPFWSRAAHTTQFLGNSYVSRAHGSPRLHRGMKR